MNNVVDLRNLNNPPSGEPPAGGEENIEEKNAQKYMNNIVDLRNLKKEESVENIEGKNAKEEETYLTEEDIPENINSQNVTHINPQRRQLLKFLLVGSGAFALGLLAKSVGFSGLFSKSKGSLTSSELKSETELGPAEKGEETDLTNLTNWKVVEKNGETTFIDRKTNEKVLILD